MKPTLAPSDGFGDAHICKPHGYVNGKTTTSIMQPDITHLPCLPNNDIEALILVPLATLLLCHLSLPLQLPFLLSRVHICQHPILALTKGCQIIDNWREIKSLKMCCYMWGMLGRYNHPYSSFIIVALLQYMFIVVFAKHAQPAIHGSLVTTYDGLVKSNCVNPFSRSGLLAW